MAGRSTRSLDSMIDDATKWIQKWVIVYAIVVAAAGVLTWPILHKAETGALAAGFYLLFVLWLASFIHLANSALRTTWWWLGVVVALSWASSYAAVVVGNMPRDTAMPGMLGIAVMFSLLAAYVAWRRRKEGDAV